MARDEEWGLGRRGKPRRIVGGQEVTMERGQEKNNPESAENSTNEAGEYKQLRYRDLQGLKEARRLGHIPITPGGEGDRDSMCSTPSFYGFPELREMGVMSPSLHMQEPKCRKLK